MKYLKLFEDYTHFNESFFGNGVYDGDTIQIPDDLAVWCMEYYSEQNDTIYDYKKIPSSIIKASKKFINGFGSYIYQGFGIDGELNNDIIFSPNNTSLSWTIDEDVARQFSEKFENEGLSPFVAETTIEQLNYVVSMDLIMGNITQDQVRMVSNEKTLKWMGDYSSESEVLVFDTITKDEYVVEPLWY